MTPCSRLTPTIFRLPAANVTRRTTLTNPPSNQQPTARRPMGLRPRDPANAAAGEQQGYVSTITAEELAAYAGRHKWIVTGCSEKFHTFSKSLRVMPLLSSIKKQQAFKDCLIFLARWTAGRVRIMGHPVNVHMCICSKNILFEFWPIPMFNTQNIVHLSNQLQDDP